VSKGEATRERILDWAFRSATRRGLEGLSIGNLASELGLSKSGLFAHFGSKEALQIAVLEAARERFVETVVRPALAARRGEPRMRKWFESWMRWTSDPTVPGGCIFMVAAVELDDREGRPREFLVQSQRELLDAVAKSAVHAVEAGDFRGDLDPDQLAFELLGIMLAYHQETRLFRAPNAEKRARTAFERLLGAARRPSYTADHSGGS
jgi:AcrR family transcriptional regulator